MGSEQGAEHLDPQREQPAAPQEDLHEEQQEDSQEDQSQEAEQAADELEEIEHDGKKYQLPKSLKPLLLMQRDYTQKTQEVAEQRRALEAQQAQIAQQAQAEQQRSAEWREVYGIEATLAEFSKVNWQHLSAQDPQQAQSLWMTYQQLKDQHAQKVGHLQQQEQERALVLQRETAKQVEQGRAILARDIPGWSPETERNLVAFATDTLEFTPQEIAQVTDPRVIKLLHRAYLGAQLEKTLAQRPAPASPKPTPVPTVGATAPAMTRDPSNPRDADRMSSAEWLKRRTEQVRKRG